MTIPSNVHPERPDQPPVRDSVLVDVRAKVQNILHAQSDEITENSMKVGNHEQTRSLKASIE